MDKLRIALFSDSALPILNGVSVSIDGLVRELRRQGHSVHVFTAAYPGFKDPDPNTYRFRSIMTPLAPGYPMAVPPFFPNLRHFREHTFDVVHTHTPFTLGFVGLRWAQSHDIPIVSTYHTLYDRYAHYIPVIPRRYIRFKIAKHTNFYYNSVRRVIVPSAAAQRWLHRHGVNTPSRVIPTGALERKMLDRAECRLQLGIAPDQRVLLYVGRLAKEKNLETLFAMAAQAMAQDPRVHLWLVGDGPYRAECTEMVRALGIGNRVRFVGFVPRADVDPYYAAADLFVFSSVTETQGLVIQEAMLYGLPAVAVVGGGASESILDGENGFVVRNDVARFAEQTLDILADDVLYARLSVGALESVRDKTLEAMAQRVVGVYREAIANEPAAPEVEPVSVR